jgi:CheY-like chemotaxis protein
MSRSFATALVISVALGVSPVALACGEGIFHMGDGLTYQGYLAPRPAIVLVYQDNAGMPRAERIAVYRGLVQAGHRVTVANGPDALSRALREQHYDVVIADLAAERAVVAATSASGAAPKLLPVVARSERNAPAVRERQAGFVLDGASLGQYLRHINQLMKG